MPKLWEIAKDVEFKHIRYKIRFLGINFSFKIKNKNSIIEGKNNFIYIKENGVLRKTKEKIPGLNIKIEGENNKIILEKPYNFISSRIIVEGVNNEIIIEKTKHTIGYVEIYFTGSQGLNFKNRKLHIKENFSSGSTAFHMWGNDSQIIIGKDCMFSSEIKIMSGDAHIILDKNSKKYLKNNEKNICELGDHVWVGMRNIICKNAKIPDNCIVGAGSVVSKKFDTKNCVIAGNPAKIIKKEVDWSRAASEN